ncbi:unnamed protein product [Musa textilis]
MPTSSPHFNHHCSPEQKVALSSRVSFLLGGLGLLFIAKGQMRQAFGLSNCQKCMQQLRVAITGQVISSEVVHDVQSSMAILRELMAALSISIIIGNLKVTISNVDGYEDTMRRTLPCLLPFVAKMDEKLDPLLTHLNYARKIWKRKWQPLKQPGDQE